jgi:DNA-binding transcriptional LysR family regulator
MSAFSRELRSFLVVSQSSSIRAAAERLNISAPALSRQIQILERSYGTLLLVRSANGIALTAEGEALRKVALDWMTVDAKFSQGLRQEARAADLRLRIGIMDGMIDTLIPPLMKRLETRFGVVELDLAVGTTGEMVERAEALDLDIIVTFNMPRLSRLVLVHSREYHIGAVHAPGFGPPGSGPMTLAKALEYPLCLPSVALSMHTRLMAEVLAVRVNPRVRISTNSITALMSFLKDGKGIGFLTWPDVCTEVEGGRLVFRPLDSRRLTETLSVGICRGNALGDATGPVVADVQAVLEALGA